jgi:hypothetical protein
MGQAAKATRQNRTITVDYQDESPYFELIHNAQFIAHCSSSKWSKHVTNSPFLARLAMAGSGAAYTIISACSNAVS